MKTRKVKDLMVPLDEYATVSMEATLKDAILALEKAQQDYIKSHYPHRAILVYDDQKNIVGKVSQLDVLKALEPKYADMLNHQSHLARLGFSLSFQKSLIEQYKLWEEPFDELCKKAAKLKVKDFMYTPQEGEYVEANATLNEAVHQIVMGHHQSLLVTEGKKIVGILRLTDLFMEVFHAIKECKL